MLTQETQQTLAAEVMRRSEAGQTIAQVSFDMNLPPVTVRRLWPLVRHRRQAVDRSVNYRPLPDHLLLNAMGKCPRCGRLGIQPCSVCDPNQ